MTKKRGVGRPPKLVPCPWCKRKMKMTDFHGHVSKCPRQPKASSAA